MTEAGITIQTRRSLRFAIELLVIALAGVLSLMAMPLEAVLPEGIDVPRAVLLIQPAVLVVLFTFAGWLAAWKTGLDAPVLGRLIDGGDWRAALSAALVPGVIGGVLVAAVLLLYGAITQDYFAAQEGGFEMPLVSRVLYGGITEEVVMRWGIMSVIALAAFKLGVAQGRSHWIGNVAAAFLFGLGHLPALFGVVAEPAGWLITLVIAGNMVAGLIFGWLYMKRGLEAAIIAHILAHVIAWSAAVLVS